jgi:4-nitrophenyl phosphatase
MTGVVAGRGDRAKPATLVFDLDGVLYVDHHGIPGAAGALAALEAAGHRLVFATNNSTKSVETVQRHIRERAGYVTDRESIVTSAMATAQFLAGKTRRCLVLGGADLAAAIAASGIEITADWSSADAVVVGLDTSLSYERLTAAVLAIRNGALFVATGLDNTYPTPEGLYPGAGSIVAAVETATGVAPVACGKPHAPMRSLVRELVGTGPVWVVGDRPETDLAMGTAEGWGTILVLSGVTGDPSDVPADLEPDLVLASIADLPGSLP